MPNPIASFGLTVMESRRGRGACVTRELWIQGKEDKNDDQYKRERGKVVIHEEDECGDAREQDTAVRTRQGDG